MVQNKHGAIRLLKAGFLQRQGRNSAYDQVKTKQRSRTVDGIGITIIRRYIYIYIFVGNPLMILRKPDCRSGSHQRAHAPGLT